MILSIKYNSEHASAPGVRYSCDKMTFTEDTLGNYGRGLCLVLESDAPPPPPHVSHTLNCLDGRNLSRPFFHVVPPSLILFQLFHSCIGGKLIIATDGTPTHSYEHVCVYKAKIPIHFELPLHWFDSNRAS